MIGQRPKNPLLFGKIAFISRREAYDEVHNGNCERRNEDRGILARLKPLTAVKKSVLGWCMCRWSSADIRESRNEQPEICGSKVMISGHGDVFLRFQFRVTVSLRLSNSGATWDRRHARWQDGFVA
jgi:hypothetical protein